MKRISITDFRMLSAKEIQSFAPIEVTKDGLPIFAVCAYEDVIVIKDLHPRVKKMLRALEKRARIGMPREEIKV